MNKFLQVLSCFLLLLSVAAAQAKWWETASFYQIYPRSFQDSDGDGVGDLKGITSRLAYLKEIGVTATWLSPIFTSPMADFGYDIADFFEVDPVFGTMADMDALLKEAKNVGVKIILDFVPNHSSDECEWFVKSVARDPEYEDFYVWHPGKMIDGVRHPPTNWISVFRGAAWTWNEQRGEYYLHQFHKKQPDLNYRNPKVVEAMREVLRFWLRKGVSGFRVDAVPHVFEDGPDEEGNFPDEPINPDEKDPEDYNYLLHIHTVDKPETTELIYDFRKVVDEIQAELNSEELVLMIEAYSPREVVNSFYGNGLVEGAQIPFNFDLITNVQNTSDAYYYHELITTYLKSLPEGRAANWVLGNHDRSRVGSRLGADRIDMMNILLKTLPGISVTYQGEEIGMTDVYISWEDTVDPQACQSNPQEFERLTRDPVRTPFQWNDEKFTGFTDGNETWLPVADNFKHVNVKKERGISLSHLNVYKRLQNLRQDPVFRYGHTEVAAINANVLAIKRYYEGSASHVVLMNLNDNLERFNLHSFFMHLKDKMQVALVTSKSIRRVGDHVNTSAVTLLPKEAIVLKNV